MVQILTLYAQRPIVEKHARYALYHPFAEAVSSMICDLPYKIVNCITFNIPLYFMTNLRREPGAFLIFLLFSFVSTLTMSMVYRTIGAASRTLAQALVPAAIILLALIIYAGFILPVGDMGPWFRWINYLNPIAYAFESLMLNEFDGRSYPCSTFVPQGPDYLDIGGRSRVCSSVGATAGSDVVLGEAYLRDSFNFSGGHLWR
jgi:ATP-binding cassette, subfamily G (WHITE), member 2, PDR